MLINLVFQHIINTQIPLLCFNISPFRMVALTLLLSNNYYLLFSFNLKFGKMENNLMTVFTRIFHTHVHSLV